ncbi:MAG: DUF4082 domain-containing protein [Verrucomicrobiia bacterium]
MKLPVLCLLATLVSLSAFAEKRPRLDLSGNWDFYADVADRTLDRASSPSGKITAPGAWQAQGYGQPGGTIPSANIGPGTSPAEYLRHNLMARCLYARDVTVPPEWKGRRVVLCVRRAYRYTDVSVNGKPVGEYEGFCSPFEFDITDALEFDRPNRLVLGVDNRPRLGRDTLGTGNLYGNWGGIGGGVYLEARPQWDADVFAMPQIAASSVVLRVTLSRTGRAIPPLEMHAQVAPWASNRASLPLVGEARLTLPTPGSNQVTCDIPVKLADVRLWSPDDPFLYRARISIFSTGRSVDEIEARFGMREIAADGRKLFLNGKPLYLSGYGDDATEPLTGMLPASKEVYLKRLRLMRSLGFNFVRHHSCVPHDEYFEAADEVGMLVQPEFGLAYTGFWQTGHRLFAREWPHVVRAFRNHPSIWAWCMGNELFLDQLPDVPKGSGGISLSNPIERGPLQTGAGPENGVFGPPGQFPTRSFKQSNYYRDVEAVIESETLTLLGTASTTRVFTDGPHELGLKFTSARDGQITRIRYLRVAEETGRHTGHIWDAGGSLLAQAEFTNETASGWQEATVTPPVPIQAGRIYVVSVNANSAYAATGATDGEGITRQEVMALVESAYRQAKELDPTRLVHASDGGTPQPFTDVLSSGSPERSRKPYLLHEYGTYCCSLPDFSLIPRLNGVIRPLTYERAERYVQEHKLEPVYPKLKESSLIMRADAQKHYMEAARASGSNNGYSFWLGVDFPDSPEGCWDEGVLNQLWEPKPHLTNGLPDWNGSTVLLTDVPIERRSFHADEGRSVGIRLWHFGNEPITNPRLLWQVLDGERLLQRGEEADLAGEPGAARSLGTIRINPLPAETPRFVTLKVELSTDGGARLAQNAWEFYAYPKWQPTGRRSGVYSEAGAVPGAVELSPSAPLPSDLRVLVTKRLQRARHAEFVQRGHASVLLLGDGGFKESRAGYFLNQHGTGFGGIIENHPMFKSVPHQGRLHLGIYQLVAGGGLLETEEMPAALRDGAVVWGLRLTGWISPVKNLRKVVHVSEAVTEDKLHLLLCNLDLLSERPECRYVLGQAIEYLASEQISGLAQRCATRDLEVLLR